MNTIRKYDASVWLRHRLGAASSLQLWDSELAGGWRPQRRSCYRQRLLHAARSNVVRQSPGAELCPQSSLCGAASTNKSERHWSLLPPLLYISTRFICLQNGTKLQTRMLSSVPSGRKWSNNRIPCMRLRARR